MSGTTSPEHPRRRRSGAMPQYVGRVVFHERPDVVRRLERVAQDSGLSVAALLRLAVRQQILRDDEEEK